jgi:hypothetical protein
MPIPDNLRKFMENSSWMEPIEKGTEQIFRLGQEGRCMMCGSALAEDTILFITKEGIFAVYCRGACLTDQQIIGWLQERHEDLVHQVEFRAHQQEGPVDESIESIEPSE